MPSRNRRFNWRNPIRSSYEMWIDSQERRQERELSAQLEANNLRQESRQSES